MAKKKSIRRTRGRQKPRTRKPARRTGRYSPEEKAEILRQVDTGRAQAEVARQYGLHPITIGRWLERREEAKGSGDESGDSGLVPRSTRPQNSPSPVDEAHRHLTIELKKEHAEMGPAQIRNQLRRFHGISLSHKTIGKILKDAGFELEQRVRGDEEAVERFEMSRPNELWTMDTKSFYIHDLRVWLIDIVDDYSRFIVGHRLLRQMPSNDDAISTLKDAITKHGKPERVLTDRGAEFHSWKGLSAFTKFLEDEGIEHSLARPHHPQTVGKIEAVHRTLEKELIGLIRFDSFAHAQREIARYFDRYNTDRTHMGIGGATPADRYFGRIDEVLGEFDRRSPSIDRNGALRLPGERAIVLQLALVEGQLELWFAGKRIVLG